MKKVTKSSPQKSPFASIDQAIAAFREGQMIIVVDDEDRENEGDLTIAAEKVTPAAINFMATHGRGLICMPMTEDRLDELDIPPWSRTTRRRSIRRSASRSRRKG
jgi:3,4-dihydroxy 2-butanone 4-phosphate synthase/GTP cyclohydrolase II